MLYVIRQAPSKWHRGEDAWYFTDDFFAENETKEAEYTCEMRNEDGEQGEFYKLVYEDELENYGLYLCEEEL